MATRFYFTNGLVNRDVAPTDWATAWDFDGAASLRQAFLHPPAGPMTASTVVSTNGGGTNPSFTGVRRYMGPPLAAQTISGSIKGQFACNEAATGNNYTLAIALRIMKADGTERAVLLAPTASDNTSATPPEMAVGTATNRRLLDASESASIALTSQACQDGDYILFELGFRQASTNTAAGTILIHGSNGDSDLAENDTTTTVLNSWVSSQMI